ncbi:homing endonuclease associated repeat-containing protein [Geodermatophilus sp. SYSU D00525]
MTATELAERLGVDLSIIGAILPSRGKGDLLHGGVRTSERFTDEAILAELRALSAALGGTAVSLSAWSKLRRKDRTPSGRVVVERFGSWVLACEAAGIPTSRGRGSYVSQWTDDQVLQALADFLRDGTGEHTSYNYDRWASGRPGTPSGSTLRQRFGGWNAARRTLASRVRTEGNTRANDRKGPSTSTRS